MKVLFSILALVAVASAGTIDIQLLSNLKAGAASEAIIEFPSVMAQVESSSAIQTLSGDAKVNALVNMLETLTQAAQAKHMKAIHKLGLKAQQFWASNIILVKGLNLESLHLLAAVEGDFLIREQHWASINPSIVSREANITQNPQWGVAQIRAPAAWAVTQGEGVVVGVIDTGVNEGHVALSGSYAGSWADPYYSTARPTDQHGHGSHCMGTILGSANGVGVAPAARWVSCRGLNHQGSGSEAALTTCAQHMVTSNPRPQVVSNSWGGGSGQTWYNSQISAWRNAGIIPVFALGNSGPSCRTANSPGDQPNVISVGATTNTDAMASFSSRGTSISGTRKPEVSAPGQNIVSCGTGSNNYATMSGTSMATPHTAGAIALLLSRNPSWGFAEVRDALGRTAAHPTLTAADRNCGLETPGNDYPNNAFGDGRIDVAAALGL